MHSRIAWDFSTRAFEASRRQGITRAVRRSLQQFGVTCFWVALALEGRAVEVWRDYRSQLLRGAERLPAPAADVPAEMHADLPVLAAWSLPNNPKMRGLGLGRVWVVACPFCRRYHMHAPEEGCRPAHCHDSAMRPTSYVLHYAGELPRGLWDRFRVNVMTDKPRLLHPPHRRAPPGALEAA